MKTIVNIYTCDNSHRVIVMNENLENQESIEEIEDMECPVCGSCFVGHCMRNIEITTIC